MITGIGSYNKTTQEFNVNWTAANGELAPQAVMLAGQYTQAMFAADRTALIALIDATSTQAGNARIAAGARDTLKSQLQTRGKQLRGVVSGQITDAEILRDLPTLPNLGEAESAFLDVFKAMSRLWARIDAEAATLGLSGPLVLQGGYGSDDFGDAIAQLQTNYDTCAGADEAEGIARGKRNNAMLAIYTRMKQYRAAAPAMLPANSPALANLPRLTPEAGTTPAGLVVTGQWDAILGKAVFGWPVSTVKNIEKLQARGCTGSVYKAEDEEVIADLPATATSLETDWGLTAPGAKISVKIYVMTTTGNENGGKAVKIVRPEM